MVEHHNSGARVDTTFLRDGRDVSARIGKTDVRRVERYSVLVGFEKAAHTQPEDGTEKDVRIEHNAPGLSSLPLTPPFFEPGDRFFLGDPLGIQNLLPASRGLAER